MENKNFMTVDEVAQELNVSKSYAYRVVRELNAEMGGFQRRLLLRLQAAGAGKIIKIRSNFLGVWGGFCHNILCAHKFRPLFSAETLVVSRWKLWYNG